MRWRTLGLTALLSALPAYTPFEGTLPVAVSGCEALFMRASGARCVRASEQAPPLVLWLEGSWRGEELQLVLEGGAAGSAQLELDPSGVRYLVQAGGARELVLRHASGAGFTLELVPGGRSPELAARLDALDERGLLTCALGHPRGALERVDAELERVRLRFAPSDQLASRVETLVEARAEVHCRDLVLALELDGALNHREDRKAAAELLGRMRHDPGDLDGRLQYDYYLGMIRERHGDLDGALEAYEQVIELGQHVAVPGGEEGGSLALYYLGAALSLRANLLVRLGRYAEARASAEASLERLEPVPWLREELELNAAWNDYLSRERGSMLAPDPVARMRALLSGLTREDLRAALQLNYAAALLQSEAVAEAEAALDGLTEAELEPHHRRFVAVLGARLSLARGELGCARALLDAAEREARLRGDDELLLGLLTEQARLEQLAERPQIALQRYAEAEQVADRLALRLPIDGSRHSFASALSRARARHIALLVERGRPREARCTVLAARARHARALIARPGRRPEDPRYFERVDAYRARGRELEQQLERRRGAASRERAALDASIDALRGQREQLLSEAMALLERDPPAWSCEQTWRAGADEGLLTMFPGVEQQGWWFFLARGEQVWARWLDTGDGEEREAALVERALAAFEQPVEPVDDEAKTAVEAQPGALAGLARLSVVPIAQLAAVDVHALPRFAGAGAPRVDYRVALGPLPGGTEASTTGLDARVLAFDDNLPEVLVEAQGVRERLRARGWDLSESWSPQHAGRPALLHYAGHGYHRGHSGWDSALAEGSEISSRTLISAQRSPRVVVLGACEAGSTELDAIDGGMNIAFAFLLAGAELVIAPDEPVSDALARDFAEALYDALPAEAAPGPAPWLEALATLRGQEQDFAAWRAWLR